MKPALDTGDISNLKSVDNRKCSKIIRKSCFLKITDQVVQQDPLDLTSSALSPTPNLLHRCCAQFVPSLTCRLRHMLGAGLTALNTKPNLCYSFVSSSVTAPHASSLHPCPRRQILLAGEQLSQTPAVMTHLDRVLATRVFRFVPHVVSAPGPPDRPASCLPPSLSQKMVFECPGIFGFVQFLLGYSRHFGFSDSSSAPCSFCKL